MSLLLLPITRTPALVALQLQGRQAEKTVVVIKQLDEGTKARPYLRPIAMARCSEIKPFIKTVNYLPLPDAVRTRAGRAQGQGRSRYLKELMQLKTTKTIKRLDATATLRARNRWFFTPFRMLTISALLVLNPAVVPHFSALADAQYVEETRAQTSMERSTRARGKDWNQHYGGTVVGLDKDVCLDGSKY
ncbi:hypothetical protein K438DRAFT_1928191 [Mycena galopus ATCC 62051]|nr:hypothetical protein K438DRAFT_1928191 [Mycena galopus ATCC 62051]